MPSKRHKDEISAESYRKAFHAAQAELLALKAAVAKNSDKAMDLVEELEHQMESEPGYYRMGRSQAGMYWVRWKWGHGPHAGLYQIGGGQTLWEALLSCQAAVDAVQRGRRAGLLDKPYRKGT